MAEWSKALRSGRSSLRWAQVRILPCAMFFYPPISDLFIAHYKADRINQCASAGLFFSFIFTKMNSKNYRWMVKTEHILQKRVWCTNYDVKSICNTSKICQINQCKLHTSLIFRTNLSQLIVVSCFPDDESKTRESLKQFEWTHTDESKQRSILFAPKWPTKPVKSVKNAVKSIA